jgi:hypothetical protein
VPESIGNLTKLEVLHLESNELTGPLPESITNLVSLRRLFISQNQLTGSIPEPVDNLVNLTEVDLHYNNLTGPIPESIGNLVNLTRISLGTNALTGPIPESIGNLVQLTTLSLYDNELTGWLPESTSGLTSLRELSVSRNNLTGPIPESIGNLSELSSLFLSSNNFTGPIPESIGNLSQLAQLYMGANNLTGLIPESIGNLSRLAELSLSNNGLTGRIPPLFGNRGVLRSLDLQSNSLEGTVPLPTAQCGFLAEMYRGCSLSDNPGLCIPDIPEYRVLAPGGTLCGLPLDPTCEPIVHAEANVFLEGPYSNGAMQASPAFTDHCPSQQPYSSPEFDGTPLDCDKPDVVLSPPDSVMDWILVSLREDVTPGSEVAGSERTAFLKTNGSIVDTSGTILAFPGVAPGAYRLVVRHRNHASVMSADTLDLSDGFGSWDFTTAMTQAYSASGAPMKQLSDGRFGMFACDANVDGQITAPDFNLWNARTTAGATGYEQADCNLDGQVTAPDFNLWNANTTAGATSQVPD